MNLLHQIFLFLLICFTSSTTFSVPKIVVLTNTTFFQKTEKTAHSEKAKIGLKNFARSTIEEQQEKNTTFHQNTCSLSSYLKEENSCVIDFQKTESKSEFKVAQFSKKESLSELENRAREVLDVFVTGAGSFVNQIDNTLSRLTNLSKFELENTGKYIDVAAHHPLAKSAFRDNFPTEAAFKQYYDEAFSVSIPQLEKFGGKGIHAKITGQQNSLYTAWRNANPGAKMTIDDMANIELQAMVNKGIPKDVATGWVVKALEKLKAQGVTNISNIPWNGVN
jgi:hypothetical protein